MIRKQEYRGIVAWGIFSVVLLAAGGGCSASAPVREPLEQEADAPEEMDVLFKGATLLVSPSTVDVGHVYKSTVKVFYRASEAAGDKACSGVLIGSRLVLTAAHCVCFAREATPEDKTQKVFTPTEKVKVQEGKDHDPREAVITKAKALKGAAPLGYVYEAGAGCLKVVSVEKVSYRLRRGGKGRQTINDGCGGRVWVHPDFEMLLDANKNLVWGSADLALILLNQPFDSPPFELAPVKLGKGEARLDEPITLVGYGRGDSARSYGDRQFGENKVAGLMRLETGSTVIAITGQSLPDGGVASHVYGGDSGGACLSKSNASALVGIVSMGSRNKRGDPISLCMSIDSHRAWLEQMTRDLKALPMADCEPP